MNNTHQELRTREQKTVVSFNLGKQADNWEEDIHKFATFKTALKELCRRNNLTNIDEVQNLNGTIFKIYFNKDSSLTSNAFSVLQKTWPTIQISRSREYDEIFVPHKKKRKEITKTNCAIETTRFLIIFALFCIIAYIIVLFNGISFQYTYPYLVKK